MFTRWDGTVFGISDSTLSQLKRNDINKLLYAYTSGIQYEVHLNKIISLKDFYEKRTHHKNALLLYNAWYVYDYFKFASSDKSDTVKLKAPDHEDRNPIERDFAGSDPKVTGGYLNIETSYELSNNFSLFIALDGKTEGWMIGEPDIEKNYSITAGLHYKRYR